MMENLLLLHRVFNPVPKSFISQISGGEFSPGNFRKFGISDRKIKKLQDPKLLKWARKQVEIAENDGWKALTYFDEDYPEPLREISHPPLVLFVKGKISCPCFSIVGTRGATEYGRNIASDFSRKIASSGMTIVSGLAYGIDTYSHRGALQSGKTIAVLGSGSKHIYPSSNRTLAEKIAENGALVTEFFPDDPPAKFRFPMRNRIIAGLSFGVLVVEAGERSGAAITAKLALEYGRDVFAVPGNIGREKSIGTNRLIQAGAKLVMGIEDIIGEYYQGREISLTEEEEFLLKYIPSGETVDAEFIAEASSLRPEEVFRILLELEMKGAIIQTSGWRYRRIE